MDDDCGSRVAAADRGSRYRRRAADELHGNYAGSCPPTNPPVVTESRSSWMASDHSRTLGVAGKLPPRGDVRIGAGGTSVAAERPGTTSHDDGRNGSS